MYITKNKHIYNIDVGKNPMSFFVYKLYSACIILRQTFYKKHLKIKYGDKN